MLLHGCKTNKQTKKRPWDIAISNMCISVALVWFLQKIRNRMDLFAFFFCDSEASAEKLEALESQEEESANFLQAQDIENITALTIANTTRTVCFDTLVYFNKWLHSFKVWLISSLCSFFRRKRVADIPWQGRQTGSSWNDEAFFKLSKQKYALTLCSSLLLFQPNLKIWSQKSNVALFCHWLWWPYFIWMRFFMFVRCGST